MHDFLGNARATRIEVRSNLATIRMRNRLLGDISQLDVEPSVGKHA